MNSVWITNCFISRSQGCLFHSYLGTPAAAAGAAARWHPAATRQNIFIGAKTLGFAKRASWGNVGQEKLKFNKSAQ